MAAMRPRVHAADKLLRAQGATHRVAVLGGGITGLTTAYRLAQDPSTRVTLYEKSNRLGGWLQSERVEVDGGSVLFEWGPRTLRASGEANLPAIELLHDLGLQDSMLRTSVYSSAAQGRYIYYPDRLVRIPTFSGGLFGVVDSLVQCVREPLILDSLLAILQEPLQQFQREDYPDESINDFLTRRFGSNFAANLASAIFHGIYAGDISKLSAYTILPAAVTQERRRNSVVLQLLLRGQNMKVIDEIEYNGVLTGAKGPKEQAALKNSVLETSTVTLKNGLEDIAQNLKAKLSAASNVDVKYNARLEMITDDRHSHDPGLTVNLAGQRGTRYDSVVSTIPPKELANLLYSPRKRENDTVKCLTNHNDYAVNVMVVNLYYHDPNIVSIPGFGYLIPRSVPYEQNPEFGLGVIFASETSVGQDTAPGTKLTVMLGGHWWDDWKRSDLPDEQSGIEKAKSLLRRHLHVTAEPAVAKARLQHSAIPQYEVSHSTRMHDLHYELVAEYDSRLQVAGAWYTGISVNDCIRSARLSAASILTGTTQWTGLERWIPR